MMANGTIKQKGQAQSKNTSPRNNSKTAENFGFVLIIPFSMLYMEILAKIRIFGNAFDDKFILLMCFTLALGFFASAICSLFTGKGRRIATKIVLFVSAFLFSFHMSYQNNFHTYFSWQTLGQAKDVIAFWKEALLAALGIWYLIIAFFIPFIWFCIFGKYIENDNDKLRLRPISISMIAALILYSSMIAHFTQSTSTNDQNDYYYYKYVQSDIEQTFRYYGILNTTRLDIKQLIFGAPVEEFEFPDDMDLYVSSSDINDDQTVSDSDTPVEYGYNMMDIDFEAAAESTTSKDLQNMDKYFSSVPATRQNEYTGIFEGKNLIFLTLEGFTDKIIDPELTPTLYRMATEGFVFENYYSSLWGGSTATGEYSNMTGNFYTTANCLAKSGSTYQPFALGNQFSKLGYKTLAYHNNTYTYYTRDKSHPNFGYKYKAIGNGLKLPSSKWPNSDEEMALATVDDYIGTGEKFHVYYMTVSGHANYSWVGNSMSTRHKNDLPEKYKKYSAETQAYLACQYEVELMLQALVQKLDDAGILEDTVFAMTTDHYPYGLSDGALSELYGLKKNDIRHNINLYRNGFILWSASMEEPIIVDTPCSSIDILPTISNLFGLEYDSRIIMGTDIMSTSEHITIIRLNGWSWISEQGTYYAYTKKFEKNDDCTMTDEETKEYVERINKIVKAKTTYSLQILDKDYYKHLLKQ